MVDTNYDGDPCLWFCGANLFNSLEVDKRAPFIFKNRIGDLFEDKTLNKMSIGEIARILKINPSQVSSIRNRTMRKVRGNIRRSSQHRKLPQTLTTKEFFINFLQKDPNDILDLDVRSGNCLKNEGINTIQELVTKTVVEMLHMPNFGEASLSIVNRALAPYDLYIGMDPALLDPERWMIPSDKEYRERLEKSVPEHTLEQAKKYRSLVKMYGENNISLLLQEKGAIFPAEKIDIIKIKEVI